MKRILTTILLLLAVAALATACGGSATGNNGVATLEDQAASASPDAEASGRPTEADREEAFLAFAQCMREHGVDMPDPQFDGNGGAVRIGPGPGGDLGEIDMDKFREANEACREHLESVMGEPGNFQLSPEDEEKILAFAKCMREHGVDMPDPQFDGNGGGGFFAGPGDGDGPRFDLGSDKFQAAMEACQAELPGVIGGRGGPSTDVEEAP